MPDGTRTPRPRRALAAAALAAALAVAGCGGDDDGDGEQAPTTGLTESTLSPEQRADADVIECLGPLPTDPNATIGGAEDCVAPTASTATTVAPSPGA